MPRKRWIIAAAILISLLVAVEVAVRRWERPKATLQIVNQGAGVMEDLVVIYADTRITAGTLLQGQSLRLKITAGPLGPLRLEFRQKGNAMQGFEIADYDPAQNLEDGYKQVLIVGTNQLQRYAEEDESPDDRRTPIEAFLQWIRTELETPLR